MCFQAGGDFEAHLNEEPKEQKKTLVYLLSGREPITSRNRCTAKALSVDRALAPCTFPHTRRGPRAGEWRFESTEIGE